MWKRSGHSSKPWNNETTMKVKNKRPKSFKKGHTKSFEKDLMIIVLCVDTDTMPLPHSRGFLLQGWWDPTGHRRGCCRRCRRCHHARCWRDRHWAFVGSWLCLASSGSIPGERPINLLRRTATASLACCCWSACSLLLVPLTFVAVFLRAHFWIRWSGPSQQQRSIASLHRWSATVLVAVLSVLPSLGPVLPVQWGLQMNAHSLSSWREEKIHAFAPWNWRVAPKLVCCRFL